MSPTIIESDGSDPHPTHLTDRVGCEIRPPREEDAAAIWSLVQSTRSLDSNSPYAYLLLCTDFASTGAVAEAGDGIAGFVLGYRPPSRPEACFVWQVGVREDLRGRGLAAALLDDVLARALTDGASFLEATVTSTNAASQSLFRALARRARTECRETMAFPAHLFPDGDHEDEVRIRIGPLAPESLKPTGMQENA